MGQVLCECCFFIRTWSSLRQYYTVRQYFHNIQPKFMKVCHSMIISFPHYKSTHNNFLKFRKALEVMLNLTWIRNASSLMMYLVCEVSLAPTYKHLGSCIMKISYVPIVVPLPIAEWNKMYIPISSQCVIHYKCNRHVCSFHIQIQKETNKEDTHHSVFDTCLVCYLSAASI